MPAVEREALVEQSECLPDALKAQMRRRAAAKGLATHQRSATGRKETLTANVRNGSEKRTLFQAH